MYYIGPGPILAFGPGPILKVGPNLTYYSQNYFRRSAHFRTRYFVFELDVSAIYEQICRKKEKFT